MKSKKKDYFFILIIGVICLWIYFNQAIILEKIIMLNPHYIEIDVKNNENRDIVAVGEKVVDIYDLVESPRRAKEQGGATLIYELPQPLEAGRYYLCVEGYTKKNAGRLLISLYDDENKIGYEGAAFLSGESMEYSMVIPVETQATKVKLLWQNAENVPTLTYFQICKMFENQDLESLKLGVKTHGEDVENVILGPKDMIEDGNVTSVVEMGNFLVYARGSSLCTLKNGKTEEDKQRANIDKLYVDYNENLYMILENGDIDVTYANGSKNTYDWTNFLGKPIDLTVVGKYMFVSEGVAGTEIFRVDNEGLVYLSKLYIDNRHSFQKVCVRNHSLYALVNGQVRIYDISYICNPEYKKTFENCENIKDIYIVDNKLYMTSYEENKSEDLERRFVSDKGTGVSIYKLVKSGDGIIIDGWRTDQEEFYPIALDNEKVCCTVQEEIESKKQKKAFDFEYAGKYYLLNETLYKNEKSISKVLNSSENIKCKEKETTQETQYESESEISCYIMEEKNTVRDVVVTDDYLFVGSNDKINVYDRKNYSLIDSEKIHFTHIEKKNSSLIVANKEMVSLYDMQEKKLNKKLECNSQVGEVNGIVCLKSGNIVICGKNGVALFNEDFSFVKSVDGNKMAGVATEVDEGYIVFDQYGRIMFLDKQWNDLKLISLVECEGDMSIDNEWILPTERGYVLAEKAIHENEEGLYVYFLPEIINLVSWNEIGWREFSIVDNSKLGNNLLFENHREKNILWLIDISIISEPKRKLKVQTNDNILDYDFNEEVIIVAAGRDGAVVFEKTDKTH